MKDYANLPAIFLITYIFRLLLTGSSIGDAIALLSLCALYGFWVFIQSKKEVPVNKLIMDRICDLEEQLKVTKDKISAFGMSHYLKK